MTALRHALFLASRSLRASPWRTLVLTLGLSIALFLPVFTSLAVARIDERLMMRAQRSPILLGHKGSDFDLVMSALYFRGQVRDTVPAGVMDRVTGPGYGEAIPLYVAHTAGGAPIVGTELSYLDARGLSLASGRRFSLLGEAVVGARVAEAFGLTVGGRVRSDQTNLYNLDGAYPYLLDVVGILAPTGTPDDDALFCDLLTAWTLDGSLHGHGQVGAQDTLATADGNVVAGAGLFMFDAFTPENRPTFHLHGDRSGLPVTAVLALPRDGRAHDELLGDFALEETLAAVRPVGVVRAVLGVVLQVERALDLYFALVAASTLAFFGLVVALGVRLRRAELVLMARLGGSRATIALMVGVEVALVVALAAVVTAASAAAGLSVLVRYL